MTDHRPSALEAARVYEVKAIIAHHKALNEWGEANTAFEKALAKRQAAEKVKERARKTLDDARGMVSEAVMAARQHTNPSGRVPPSDDATELAIAVEAPPKAPAAKWLRAGLSWRLHVDCLPVARIGANKATVLAPWGYGETTCDSLGDAHAEVVRWGKRHGVTVPPLPDEQVSGFVRAAERVAEAIAAPVESDEDEPADTHLSPNTRTTP